MADDRLPAGVTVEDVVEVLRPFADYADFCERKNIQPPPKNLAARTLLNRLPKLREAGGEGDGTISSATETRPSALDCRCLLGPGTGRGKKSAAKS